jgi:putative acetyltransferase
MHIRLAEPGDAEAMAEVCDRSVQAIGSRDYSPEQIAAWIGQGAKADRFRARLADGRRCWVAVDEADRLSAFIDLEADGHIDFLYAAPEAAGTGVAGRLLEALEAAARADGMTRLYVEASEAARRFFLKRGYAVTARRDFEIEDVAIHNYAMERRLA